MKNTAIFLAFSLIFALQTAFAQKSITVGKQQHTPAARVITSEVVFAVHETQADNTPNEFFKLDAYIKKYRRPVPGARGMVNISFTNEPDGSLGHIKVLKSLNEAADREAVRLIRSYQHWTPDSLEGKPTVSTYTTDIKFP